jgi:hypothetical protein
MRTVALVIAAATLAAPASGQQRPRQPSEPQAAAPQSQAPAAPAGPRAMGRGLETGGLAGWLASNPAGLSLTADQLTRIRATRDQVVQANAPLRGRLQAALAGRDLRTIPAADRRALMDSTRAIREQMRTNAEQGRTAVTGILTPAQQQTLDRTHPNWRTGPSGVQGAGGRGGRMMRGRGRGAGGAAWMRSRGPMGGPMTPRMGTRRWAGPGVTIGPRMREGYRMGFRAGLRMGRRFGPMSGMWRGRPSI